MEFTSEQWEGLARHAEQVGLLFLSSAFSIAAVELLDRIGVPAWKVGSGEFRSWELLTAMARTGRPVLLSTGMSRVNEVAAGVDAVRANGGHVALLQCTSRYPAKLQDVGLNVLTELRERFDTAVGLSDHSGTPWPALAAMALGADLVEVHVTFDRRMFGPDTPASITLDEISLLAGARDAFFEMLMNPVDKDAMAAELSSMRDLFAKSLAPVRPLPAGTVLEASMLTPKKPGTGIPSEELEQVVGRRLIRDVQPNRLLSREDLEPTR
jgi:N-acetylneuraminate synthase